MNNINNSNIEEHSTFMSLRIPQFMDGQDYWQLFDEMTESKGFIFLGIYTKNFNVNEHNDNLKMFNEMKQQFN